MPPYLRAKFERHRLGLSQSDVAIRSKVSQTIVSAIENGRVNPTAAELDALAAVFGVDAALLLKPVLPQDEQAASQ